MRKTLLACVLVLGACLPAFGQEIPHPDRLPTEPANKAGDVWIWVESPLGVVGGPSVDIAFWAFRCGGSIASVKPSSIRTGPLPYISNLPRPDIQAAMAAKCGSIPANIGYRLTMDFNGLPRGPDYGYMIDVEVTDDLGRKTMLRQTRGSFSLPR